MAVLVKALVALMMLQRSGSGEILRKGGDHRVGRLNEARKLFLDGGLARRVVVAKRGRAA